MRMTNLWTEDECLLNDPSAEHLCDAWLRITGRQWSERGPILLSVDNGDSGYDVYADGWVRGWAYDGDSISKVLT